MDSVKRTLCSEAKNLSMADKIDIMRKVKSKYPERLNKSATGTHINLDRLDDELINELYELVKHRLHI